MHTTRNRVRSYAAALLALQEAQPGAPPLREALQQLAGLLRSHVPLAAFLADNQVTAEGRRAAVRDAMQNRVPPPLLAVLDLLLQNGEPGLLPAIADAFADLLAENERRTRGTVRSAVPLDPDHLQQITDELARILGHPVQLDVEIDPSLLGGLHVRIGDFVIDGSVNRQLEMYRRTLSQ